MSCLLRKQWSSLEQGPQGPLFPQGQQPGASRDPREEASASFQARKQPLRRGSERQEPGQHLRTCPPTAPFFPEPDRPTPAGPPRPSLSSRGTAAGPLLSMESPTQVPYIDTACPRVCMFLSNTFKKQVFSSFPFQQHSGRVPRGGLREPPEEGKACTLGAEGAGKPMRGHLLSGAGRRLQKRHQGGTNPREE